MIPDKERQYTYMAINKISEFPKVTPSADDKILIEKNGEGGSATLASLPISTAVETRLTNLTLNAGDSSAECADARVNADESITYPSLKARLDAEHSELKGDLDHITSPTKNLWVYGDLSFLGTISIDVNIPAGGYSLSAIAASNDTDYQRNGIVGYDSDNNITFANSISRNERNGFTFTTTAETVKILFYASSSVSSSSGDTATFSDIQIERGTDITEYEYPLTAFDKVARKRINNSFISIENINKRTFSLIEYTSETNGFINSDGTFKANVNYRVTRPIYIKEGESFTYRIRHATTLPIIALYSSNEIKKSTLIEKVDGVNGWNNGIYTAITSGYIIFCYYNYNEAGIDGYVIFTENIGDNEKAYIKKTVSLNDVPKLNIICFGDSILGNDGETIGYLKQFSGANVMNFAIGGTSVSPRTSTSDNYYYFDGENLISALVHGDFSSQEQHKGSMTNAVKNRLTELESLDMSTVDLVIFAWGTNDYTQGKTIEQITASLGNCIDMIQSHYPKIKILVLTPTWRIFSLIEDGDNKIYNVSTLKEIAEAIELFCKNKRISVMNGYQNMPLCISTVPTYMDDVTTSADQDSQTGVEIPSGSGKYYSGVHFNNFGNKMYAHLINGKIQSLY